MLAGGMTYDAKTNENTAIIQAVTIYGTAKRLKLMPLDSMAIISLWSVNFDVKKKNANTVVLTGFKDKEGNKLPDISAQLGQTLHTPVGKLSVLRGKSFNQWANEEVHVSRMPISFAALTTVGISH